MEATKNIFNVFMSNQSKKRKAEFKLSNDPYRAELTATSLKTKEELISTETAVKKWKNLDAKAFKRLAKSDVYDQLMGKLETFSQNVRLSEKCLEQLTRRRNLVPILSYVQTSTIKSEDDPQTSSKDPNDEPQILTTNPSDDLQTSINEVTTSEAITSENETTEEADQDLNEPPLKRQKTSFFNLFSYWFSK